MEQTHAATDPTEATLDAVTSSRHSDPTEVSESQPSSSSLQTTEPVPSSATRIHQPDPSLSPVVIEFNVGSQSPPSLYDLVASNPSEPISHFPDYPEFPDYLSALGYFRYHDQPRYFVSQHVEIVGAYYFYRYYPDPDTVWMSNFHWPVRQSRYPWITEHRLQNLYQTQPSPPQPSPSTTTRNRSPIRQLFERSMSSSALTSHQHPLIDTTDSDTVTMGQSLSVPRPSALDGSPSSQSVQASSSDSTVPSEADEVSDTDTPFDAAAGTSLPPDAMREINRASTAYNSAIDALQEDNEALDVRVEAARRATLLRMNIDGSNGEASSLPTFTGILPPLPIHSRYVAPAGNSSIPREPALAAGVTPAQSELARAAMATSVPAASGGPTPQEDPVAAMANALGVIRQLLGLPEDAGARVRRATPEVLNGLEAVAVNDLGEEERVCPICQERFGDTVPFNGQPEAPVRLPTSCRHVFGSSCIRTWLAGSCTCPLCRERMASEDGAAVEEEGSGDESDSDLMVFSEDESDEL